MLRLALLAVAAAFLGVNGQYQYTGYIDLTNASTPLSCLAESTGVHVPGTVPCNPYEPLQQHLAFAGPTGMTVSWSTFAQLDNPQVYYGESPTALTSVASGSSTTYATSRVWDNHVTITRLKPGTKYWYRVSYQLRSFLSFCLYLSCLTFFTETVLAVRIEPPTPSQLPFQRVMKHLSRSQS